MREVNIRRWKKAVGEASKNTGLSVQELGLDQIFGDVVFVGIYGDEFTDCPFNADEVEDFLT